jgi:eukaryotic-like serine/threonine-protein kinase
MSPEQARGLDVDARADIWALSVVLYEAVTAKLPFDGPTYAALLCAILERQPPPITELGVADPQLWALISRGLEKEPDRRWASMRELGTALAHWLSSRGVADDVTGAALLSTWIAPKLDSERPPMPSLPGVADDSRASLAQSAGEGATQLSFHDGSPAAAPSMPNGRQFATIGAGIGGVLVVGAVVAFLATRPRLDPEPAPTTTLAATEPTTEQSALAPNEPPPPDASSVEPAVAPTALLDELPEPPAPQRAPTARPRPPPPAKPAEPLAVPKPKPKPAEGVELDIKTTF